MASTSSAVTPPGGVELELVASMLRLVSKRSRGSASPSISSVAPSGSHAGWDIGYLSTRYVRRAPTDARSSRTYPARSNRSTMCAIDASKPRFPGQRTNWSRKATVVNALSPEQAGATSAYNFADADGACAGNAPGLAEPSAAAHGAHHFHSWAPPTNMEPQPPGVLHERGVEKVSWNLTRSTPA